ncbi:helix-turn-helix transcriptional regulator [Verminephrobacter eiseniae]|uniref:LuxR C-terminal-related transcriptional regulator n=1 Tax=Verminephrobacter eiseniae TaxID=364317 RepID=UPI00223829C1|nr:LuxR C-terminal-related transcriptional regulator [Verminephrobacter eiseniae]MCW5259616.1 helix-turn-helix transcriptional regulator [Verminephrobacter eiseniae]
MQVNDPASHPGAVGVGITPNVVASKLMPPASADTILARPHLVDGMRAAHAARLVLIRAPAGFGKTTLMQQYAASCDRQRRVTIWLRVDQADNDLPRFVGHLGVGLRTLTPDDNLRTVFGERLAASVIETVASFRMPFAILLDDFESIQSASVLNFVQHLIDALPPNGTLVIASRTTPALGLGRIRARGQLLEIDSAELRFSLPEATAFIRDKCALPLRDKDIATLHRCTEGWAAAIFLATLSLRQRTDYGRFVASFSGTNTQLAVYLTEDILGQQSESCRTFLIETSVLTQLSAPLCDAITGRHDSGAMLDHLERSNLFLFPLDSERNEYRYHSLFASFLQHRLRALHPGREAELHAAAAHWFLDAGRPVPAIDHLLQAGMKAQAIAQLGRHAGTLLNDGRVRLLGRWFDQIRDALPRADPRVRISDAWVLLFNRRFDEATAAVQRIVDDHAADDSCDTLLLQAETLRCTLYAMSGQLDACLRAGLPHLDRLSPDETFQYCMLAISLSYCLMAAQRYDEARAVLARASSNGRSDGSVVLRSVADCIDSVIDLVHGRLGSGRARLKHAEHHWNECHGEVTGGRASAGIALAMVLYEADELEETGRLIAANLPYAKMNGPVDSMTICHVLSARVALIHGDRDLWQRRLVELEELGRQVGLQRVICSAWLERARVSTLDGAFDAADQALNIADLHGAWERDDLIGYANEVDLPSIARWRLQIARGNDRAVCAALADVIVDATARQRYWRAIKLHLLRAMALDRVSEHDAAFDELTDALRLASHEGFFRTFLDEGERLSALLQRWATRHRAAAASLGIAQQFLSALLERIDAAARNAQPSHAAAPSAKHAADAEALTPRELDVLRMLAMGHRNRVLAEKLFVSEFTVKSHLRRISAKLDAQSRTEAVAIGRARGLIE